MQLNKGISINHFKDIPLGSQQRGKSVFFNFIIKKKLIFRGSHNFIPAVLLVLTLTGCGTDIEMPEVFDVLSYKISTDQGTSVKVIFSEEMNRISCESAFLLSSPDGAVKGNFSWNSSGKSFVFTPAEKLISGTYYTVTIARSASDISDNKIKTEFLYSFYAGTDIVSPRVAAVIPGNYTHNFPRDGIIRINFSEPMDRTSVERNIKFYPSHGILFSWTDAETVNIIPLSPYDFMTDYTCTIGRQCADVSGNLLLEEKKILFTSGSEFLRPYITEISSTPQSDPDVSGNVNWITGGNFSVWRGVDKNTVLNFRFSESVDRQSFIEALKISPAAELSVSWSSDTICSVNFMPGLTPGIKYELRVLKSLKDVSGNEALDSVILYFLVNAVSGSIPEIISASLKSSDETILQSMIPDAVSNINISPYEDGKCKVSFIFNKVMDQVSVHERVMIEKIIGLNSGEASVFSYDWNEEGNELETEMVSVKEKNLYKITIPGGENGIKSMDGNAMNKDIIFYFTVNGEL